MRRITARRRCPPPSRHSRGRRGGRAGGPVTRWFRHAAPSRNTVPTEPGWRSCCDLVSNGVLKSPQTAEARERRPPLPAHQPKYASRATPQSGGGVTVTTVAGGTCRARSRSVRRWPRSPRCGACDGRGGFALHVTVIRGAGRPPPTPRRSRGRRRTGRRAPATRGRRSVARLEHAHGQAAALELARRDQPGEARADHDDVGHGRSARGAAQAALWTTDAPSAAACSAASSRDVPRLPQRARSA
jgi:hypothetical protein